MVSLLNTPRNNILIESLTDAKQLSDPGPTGSATVAAHLSILC